MVPAAVVDATVARARAAPAERRHHHRRRQLLLHRRHPAADRAAPERHPLCRRRHERRRLGTGARLLHDDRRRQGSGRSAWTRSSRRSRRDAGTSPRTPGREKVAGTAEDGYLHCGPSGAGHFVKMVHNGIEYGIMAAYAEGMNILRHANVGKTTREVDAETTPLRNPEHYQYDFNLPDVAEVWRRGSVIASWLLDLTATRAARSRPSWPTSRAASPTRAKAAGPSWPRSTRARPRRS